MKQKLKLALKYLFGLFFILGGANHFIQTDFYIRMMPPYLPLHLFLVYLSGLCEIALGILFLIPKSTRIAAWGLIALLIAVFPANVQMATHPEAYPQFSLIALWLRLPFQALLIGWAFLYTRHNNRRSRLVS